MTKQMKSGEVLKRKPVRFLLKMACLIVALGMSSATAQESRGALSGRVTDNTGASVPGADIEVTNTDSNTTSKGTSNEAGLYTVPYLNPGPYKVSVGAKGFSTVVREGMEVRVGDKLTLDIQLKVGELRETITVTGETPLLEASSASISQVVDRRRISELPLGDGNPITLLRLAAGVVAGSAFFTSGSSLSNSGPAMWVSSGAIGGNEYTLDGAPNTSDYANLKTGARVGFEPPTDSVEEFRVVSSSFDAQLGHTSGATVDLAIRSGTNTPHGTLYEFVRNDILGANSFFTNRAPLELDSNGKSKRPARRYNRYGGSFGGPVWAPRAYDGRNKAFFFVGYENIRTIKPSYSTFTVPLMQYRTGDFSDLAARGLLIYDPLTARKVGDRVVRDPIQCGGRIGVICPSRLDPVAKQYLSFLPPPNLPGTQGNFYGNGASDNTYWALVIRFDYSVGTRHRMFFRYANGKRVENQVASSGTNNGVRLNGTISPQGPRGFIYDHVYLASPSTILNLRVSYARYVQQTWSYAQFETDPAIFGFSKQTLSYYPDRGIPSFSVGGYSQMVVNSGRRFAARTPAVQSILTKISGGHNMRLGYDSRVFLNNNQTQQLRDGQYVFNNSYTRLNDLSTSVPTEQNQAQSLTALLLGIPTGGTFYLPANTANTNVSHGLFFQDDWKVSRRLTLNLGIRYDYESPMTERYNRNTRGFDATTPSPIQAAVQAAYARNPIPEIAPANFRVLGGLLFTTADNRGAYIADKNNIQPRFGFAYQLSGKTVVRGGFAIAFAPLYISAFNQPGFDANTPIDPSPDLGLTFTASLANAWPNGLIPAKGAADGLLTFVGQNIKVIPADRKSGQMQRFELSVQRELPGRVMAELTYINTRGSDLATSNEMNPIPRQYLSTSPVRDQAVINNLSAAVPNPFLGIAAFQGTSLFTSTTVQRQQLLRPFPQFTGISAEGYDGSSSYNAGTIRLEKRFSQGYTVMGSYTRSKLLSRLTRLNATDLNYENRLDDRGDSPTNISLSGIWELPFGKGRSIGHGWKGAKESLLGGFQIQGIFTYQASPPLSLGNVYYTGSGSALQTHISGSTLGRLGGSNITDNVFLMNLSQSGFYFTDAAVQTNGVIDPVKQRADSRINLSQNIRTLPSEFSGLRNQLTNTVDLSLLKNFAFGERVKLQFRVEALNAANHTIFSGPDLNPLNATFGQVTSSSLNMLPREYQLGLKLLF